MKNYDEITNTLLQRRDRYIAQQKKKRKKVMGITIPLFGFCLVTALGVGVWQSGLFRTTEDSGVYTAGGENSEEGFIFCGDYWVPDNGSEGTPQSSTSTAQVSYAQTTDADVLGLVVVDGVTYIQFDVGTAGYTPDTCLGAAGDFEGTYQTYMRDPSIKLYTTKENPDVLLVQFEAGGAVALKKTE